MKAPVQLSLFAQPLPPRATPVPDLSLETLLKQMKLVRSIEEQTGWRRGHPQQICQDQDVLAAVREVDFDLHVPGFVPYFEERTGYRISQVQDFEAWKVAVRNPTDRHLTITRGKLQDAWELWKLARQEAGRRAAWAA